jgi:hypothetical protein
MCVQIFLGDEAFDTSNQVPCFALGYYCPNPGVLGGAFESRNLQNREQHYWNVRVRGRHLLCCFDAVHVRHRQIQHHHVWLESLEFLDSRTAALGFTNSPMARTEQRTKAKALNP